MQGKFRGILEASKRETPEVASMFRTIRYQTGEVREVAEEMKKGNIPCLEVQFQEEFSAFVLRLREYKIYQAVNMELDKHARDRVEEHEFEFRAAFTDREDGISREGADRLMFLDVYYEEEPDETYDPVGEM